MSDAAPRPSAPGGASKARPALSEVVLVTGISGSGKSVALHALEDAGFFCVDNLPPELLREFLRLEAQRADRRIAIAVDVRSAGSLPHLLPLLAQLGHEGYAIQAVFLDASTDALLRRFSETRRPHPLSEAIAAIGAGKAGEIDGVETVEAPGEAANDDAVAGIGPAADRETPGGPAGRRALVDAIEELERELLAELRELSTVIDTSQLRPVQLRAWMRELVRAAESRVTLVFESFAFKHGVPLDADYVFDIRVLPNPYYVRELRPLTGRDDAVAAYLEAQPEALDMLAQIGDFLGRWLPSFEADQRSYLTVAIGCTGGQHRSVWFAERLAERFGARAATLIRHREIDLAPESFP